MGCLTVRSWTSNVGRGDHVDGVSDSGCQVQTGHSANEETQDECQRQELHLQQQPETSGDIQTSGWVTV